MAMAVRAMSQASGPELEVRKLLARVLDPEIPVLSIVDLGILREVRQEADGRMRVAITPTYSGCDSRRGALAPLDERLADSRGQGEAAGVRNRAAGGERGEPAAAAGSAHCELPALWQPRERARERIRLDTVQGSLSLQCLRRAVRLLQVHLRC